eukprot:gene4868-6068_t
MEAIVLKVLKKYLKLFIKNFTSDNFSMSLLKGEGTLVDLNLNENIIQELLMIPLQFKVTHASCDSLTAKVPWTSFKKEPITISLQTITINLNEPETIVPIPSQLKKFKKKNKNKRNEVTENLQIEVKSLKLNIASLHGNSLMLEIQDVLIQSTNSNFQVGDLSQIKTVDKEQGIELLHKLITAKSISIKIQDIGGFTNTILDNMPLKILYCSKRRIKDWVQLSAKLEFLIKNINLNWNLLQLHLLQEMVEGFQNTLARAIPALPNSSAESTPSSKSSKSKSKEKDTHHNGSSPSITSTSPTNTKLKDSPSDISSPHGSGAVDEQLPVPKHSDFSYDFHIERWKLALVDNFSGGDTGYLFKGEGLHFGFTSANTIFKPTNPDTGSMYYQLPIRETILSVVMNSLSIHDIASFSKNTVAVELCNSQEEKKSYDKTITSISSDGIPERPSIHHYTGPYLLKGNLFFRKPIITDKDVDPFKQIAISGGPPLIGLELNIHLKDFKFQAERRSLKRLISFLKPPESEDEYESLDQDTSINTTTNGNTLTIIEESNNSNIPHTQNGGDLQSDASNSDPTSPNAEDQQQPHKKKTIKQKIESGKKKISNFKRKLKLGEHWKNQIKIILKATNTQLIIPQDPTNELFKGMTMKINFGSFVMRNHSDWKSVPHLLEGLQLISSTAVPEPITMSGLDHRFSFQMENITCIINENEKQTIVLEPTTISLFLRVSRSNELLNEKRIPKIDVSFISTDFNYKLTSRQSQYLDFIGNKYLAPKKIRSLLRSRISRETKKRLKAMDTKHQDRTLTIKNKVEKTLQRYYWNVYISIQRGEFFLPLQYFLDPKSAKKIHELEQQPQPFIFDDEQPLSQLKAERLGIILQNNVEGQVIVIKVGSFEAHGIDHPKLSTTTILRPLPIPEDEIIPAPNLNDTNLLVTYRRKQKKIVESNTILVDGEMDEWVTDVWVKLQGTQVKVMKKYVPPGTAKSSSPTKKKIKMPDIKNFITKVVGVLERKKDKLSDIKKGIKKVHLNLKWGVELGNCEILLGEKSKPAIKGESGTTIYSSDERPKGIIKITDTNRKVNAKAYKDMEFELLKKNSERAETEVEKELYTNKIAQLEEELKNLKKRSEMEKEVLVKQYQELEGKFIESKYALAELEARYN